MDIRSFLININTGVFQRAELTKQRCPFSPTSHPRSPRNGPRRGRGGWAGHPKEASRLVGACGAGRRGCRLSGPRSSLPGYAGHQVPPRTTLPGPPHVPAATAASCSADKHWSRGPRWPHGPFSPGDLLLTPGTTPLARTPSVPQAGADLPEAPAGGLHGLTCIPAASGTLMASLRGLLPPSPRPRGPQGVQG